MSYLLGRPQRNGKEYRLLPLLVTAHQSQGARTYFLNTPQIWIGAHRERTKAGTDEETFPLLAGFYNARRYYYLCRLLGGKILQSSPAYGPINACLFGE